MAASLDALEARLSELQGHFDVMAVLCQHSCDAIDRRDDQIARLGAMLDQSEAARDEQEHQRRIAQREVERLRRVCRAAGIDFTTGGVS